MMLQRCLDKMANFLGGSSDIVIMSCTLNMAESPCNQCIYDFAELRRMERERSLLDPGLVMSPDVTIKFNNSSCLWVAYTSLDESAISVR
jgi:hypothetical protein